MSGKTKFEAIRLTVLALAVVTGSVFAVARYGAFLASVNWALVAIILFIAAAAYAVYYYNSLPANTYDVLDLVTTNGKADLWKHFVVVMGVVSVWVIIQKVVNDPHGDITGLLTIVLGIFVGKEAASTLADAFKNRPPAPDAGDVNILAGAKVTPAAEAPAPADAAAETPEAPKIRPKGRR